MATRLVDLNVQNISLVKNAANRRRFLLMKQAEEKSAVQEVEERVAARLALNPTTATRVIAIHELFRDDPALYERYRAETTVGSDGYVLSRNPSAYNIGIAKSDGDDVSAEVQKRIETLVSKNGGLTPRQAVASVFNDDPSLYEKWMRESYA